MLFMSCVCQASGMLIAALWSQEGERADLLALVCDVYCDFVTFPFGTRTGVVLNCINS